MRSTLIWRDGARLVTNDPELALFWAQASEVQTVVFEGVNIKHTVCNSSCRYCVVCYWWHGIDVCNKLCEHAVGNYPDGWVE